MKSQHGSVHTKDTKILTNFIELDLQRGLLIRVLLKLSLDLTIATVLSDDNGDEPSLTSGDLSTRQENGGGHVVGASLLVAKLRQLLLPACLAETQSLLLKLVRFTSHSGLIRQYTRSLYNNTIDGDVHTGLNLQKVSNNNVAWVDTLFFTVSLAGYLKLMSKFIILFS